MNILDGYELYRVDAPTGRMIGDNGCAYERLIVVALCLKTSAGLAGWGYCEVQATGQYVRPAPWIRPVPERVALAVEFERTWWTQIQGKEIDATEDLRKSYRSSQPAFDAAVSLALWDLKAQQAGLPLYRLLGGTDARPACRVYGSPLDFPLADAEAVSVVEGMLALGIRDIKVKVGAPTVERDIERLRLIASAAGPDAAISADANEAWDWITALQRLDAFERAGVGLSYIEDPLPRHDVAGLRELTARTTVPVAGHDYLMRIDELAMLADAGLGAIRTNGNIDYTLECIDLAEQRRLPVYVGNSFVEHLIEVACAFPIVDRIEYSALSLSDLVVRPVVVRNGAASPSDVPGHGMRLRDSYRGA